MSDLRYPYRREWGAGVRKARENRGCSRCDEGNANRMSDTRLQIEPTTQAWQPRLTTPNESEPGPRLTIRAWRPRLTTRAWRSRLTTRAWRSRLTTRAWRSRLTTPSLA